MAFQKWLGPLFASGLVGFASLGCSSSSNGAGPENDAGEDGPIHRMLLDTGVTTGEDAEAGVAFDMTTGKVCTKDSDCVGDGGPGVNVCSGDSTLLFSVTNVPVMLEPTPVCILPPPTSTAVGNCDPAPNGADGLPHFCDGPDDITKPGPGICIPFDPTNPQPNQGTCFPLCTFQSDGTKVSGCAGNNACVPFTFTFDTNSVATGYGACQGGCQQDSDCSALGTGFVCQTDIGFCTNMPLTRTKTVGTSCSAAGTTNDQTTGACNCVASSATDLGACATSCVVGGLPCPNGLKCDSDLLSPIVFVAEDGGMTSVPLTQSPGLSGTCSAPCSFSDAGVPADAGALLDAAPADAEADAGTDAAPATSGGCPPNLTCQAATSVGPDCLP
jgi:hypothetical protein